MAQEKLLNLATLEYFKEKQDAVIDEKDAKVLVDAKAYADGLADNYDAAGTAQTKVDELANSTVKANTEAIAKAQGEVDALEEVVASMYTNAKIDEVVADAKKAGTDAQDAVDALEEKVGEVPADKTVVQMIADAQTAATYDDTKVKEDIKANADAIALLNDASTVEGSVDYKIAQAVAAIMENPDETMNSINELVTWINGHAEDALELSNKVTTNEGDIAALEGLVGTTGVAQQITEAIEVALKIDGVDKYALATDLTAAIARIATLEGKAHEHANKEVLDGITAEKVAAWDAAEANAKAHATALDEAMDARVDALETAIGENGSVSTQISDAIAELDADVTSAEVEAGKGVRVQVVETDGKVTTVAVTGNYDNSYDAKGASAQALVDAKAYADGKDTAIETAQTTADNAATAVSTLENGKVAENASAIAELQAAQPVLITTEEIDAMFATEE